MALIASRIETITRQISICEDMYQAATSESEREGLQNKMDSLTTEYIVLLASMS